MELSVYEIEAELEESHWWFVCRRYLFAREIKKLLLSKDTDILDIGTSTGTNLRMLRDFGFMNVVGLELSSEAISYCESKELGPVEQGSVCSMPFPDQSFSLVLATDILEHVDDDERALKEIKRVLKPGGVCLITVPTFQILWGKQDELSHHKRRYYLSKLKIKLANIGLVSTKGYYFNYLLFIPILVARFFIKIFKLDLKSENQINTKVLNKLLTFIFYMDILTASVLKPPFGVSALLICKHLDDRI